MDRIHPEACAKQIVDRLPRRAAVTRLAAGAAGLIAGVVPAARSRWRAAAQAATPPAGASAFAVLRRYTLVPGTDTDELVHRVEEGFVPIVSQIPGFQEYLLLETADGMHVSISLFADPSGAEESTSQAAGWAAEAVAPFIEGPPEVTEGWIRLHVTAEGRWRPRRRRDPVGVIPTKEESCPKPRTYANTTRFLATSE